MPSAKRQKLEEPPNCIDSATALSTSDFIASFLPSSDWQTYTTPSKPPETLHLSLLRSTELSKDELSSCFHLIAESSKSDYERSILGWHPVKKRKEMKLLDLKYLLIKASENGPIQGFLSFMPTHEDSISCLYIYEIHLTPELRGTGLGSHLIKMVEGVAGRVGVEKVMLTCFVRNRGARRFYEKLGYSVEEVIEGRKLRGAKKTDEVDESGYLIMGKAVEGSGGNRKSGEKDEWEDVDSDTSAVDIT